MSKRMIDILSRDGSSILPATFVEGLHEAVVLTIDNVAQYFYENERNYFGWQIADFPNLAPPYETFWMEFRVPNVCQANPDSGLYGLHAIGALFLATDIPALAPADRAQIYARFPPFTSPEVQPQLQWWLTVTPIIQQTSHPGSLTHLNVNCNLFLDAQGQVFLVRIRDETQEFAAGVAHGHPIQTDAQGAYIEAGMGWVPIIQPVSGEEFLQGCLEANQLLYPFWLAISFLHCKNVTTTSIDPCHSRKPPKPGDPCRRAHYKILDIHPMREVLRREGKQDTTGLKQALHTCRGHFRDYRQGRGLFGKYKGLFWVDSHVRGSSTYGKVVKDYAIHPT